MSQDLDSKDTDLSSTIDGVRRFFSRKMQNRFGQENQKTEHTIVPTESTCIHLDMKTRTGLTSFMDM